MIQTIPQTKIVKVLKEARQSIKILQGGTSSGKTYAILYRILIGCLFEWKDETIDVIRDTFPALRISAMKDWEDILKNHDLYNKNMHNKSDKEYTIGTNIVRFYSADNEEKMRGPRRHRSYFNEILEMKKMDVEQVMMRTKIETWCDYNPSETFHWFYDEYADDPDNFFHKSTYKDNPFLEDEIVRRILKFKERDPNMWRIYGLGEKGVPQSTIYTNWKYAVNKLGREVLFNQFEGQRLFGMDFGFNDPTTLVRIKFHEKGGIFADQLMYQSGLTSEGIIGELDKLRKAEKITYDDEIWADNARPEIIEDIRRSGYNIRAVKKGKDSVLRGINFIKKNNLFITKDSTDMIKEIRAYKWKTDKNEKVLDTPVDLNDHLMDALRYGLEKLSRNRREIGVA